MVSVFTFREDKSILQSMEISFKMLYRSGFYKG